MRATHVRGETGAARSRLAPLQDPAEIATPGRRSGFVFRIATLPALLALPLIIAMRVPGSLDQVAIVPVAEFAIGLFWIQASAWCTSHRLRETVAPPRSAWGPLIAVAALLLIFQTVLRPGIAFF